MLEALLVPCHLNPVGDWDDLKFHYSLCRSSLFLGMRIILIPCMQPSESQSKPWGDHWNPFIGRPAASILVLLISVYLLSPSELSASSHRFGRKWTLSARLICMHVPLLLGCESIILHYIATLSNAFKYIYLLFIFWPYLLLDFLHNLVHHYWKSPQL